MNEISIFDYNGYQISFDNNDKSIMINAVEMARPFNARPSDWLRTEQAGRMIDALAKSQKCVPTDLVSVEYGGYKSGTWMHEDVALMFAQWLSPEFYIWCNKKTKELLKTGKTELTPLIPNFNNPAEAARAWANEYEAKQLAESQVKELAPKAEVYDQISNADNLMTLNDAAKALGKGRNKLMEYLRDVMILRKNNTPYQEFINAGYFVVKVKPFMRGEENMDYMQTFVTGKGLTWLSKRLAIIKPAIDY